MTPVVGISWKHMMQCNAIDVSRRVVPFHGADILLRHRDFRLETTTDHISRTFGISEESQPLYLHNMSDKWPPALKIFVNQTFANCTDSNRAAVEAELKAAIFKAFNENTIWNIVSRADSQLVKSPSHPGYCIGLGKLQAQCSVKASQT